MFTKDKVLAEYNSLYDSLFRKLDDESEAKTGLRYTHNHKWRIIHDVLLLPPVTADKRVLEIGPSMTSVLIHELTGAHVETLCIDDLNHNFLDPFHIPLHICDITREVPPIPRGSYDLILFCEVLEHFLIAPHAAIRTILSLCKPEGVTFFSVPNFATIQKRIMLLRGKNPQDPLHEKTAYFAHIREPVFDETKQWWESAGGTVMKHGFTNYDEDAPGRFLSKLFWTARFLKIRNWYGLSQVWLPSTRQYFYLFIRKRLN